MGLNKIQKSSHIEQTLLDLTKICVQNDIRYLVIGSCAMICALDKLVRTPFDIDCLYDVNQEEILEKELTKLGYKKVIQNHTINKFLQKPLVRYVNNKKIIEPRRVKFRKSNLEIPLYLPFIGGVGSLNLKFQFPLFTPVIYQFGKAKFYGLKKEALCLALQKSVNLNFGGRKEKLKRAQDLRLLLRSLNNDQLKILKEDKSGLYFKNFPMFT